MPLTIVATSGAANANSYVTLAEADAYFESRLWIDAWDDSDDKTAAIIWATRVFESMLQPYRYLVRPTNGAPYYITRSTWTGLPSTTTQALQWPRTGMYDRNGNAIAVDALPTELKNALCELAMQLSKSDRTLDSDVAVQGITSVRAGSVAVTFKNEVEAQVLPDVVENLLVPSWLTDELIEPAYLAQFDVFGTV